MKKTKKKLRLLQFASIFLLFAPLAGVVIYNFDSYFSMQEGKLFSKQYLDVAFGGGLAVGVGVLLALGKTKLFKGSFGLWIGALIAYLLGSIIYDITLILAAVALGKTFENLLKGPINTTKEIYKEERQAATQAKALNNVMQNYSKKPQEIHGRG